MPLDSPPTNPLVAEQNEGESTPWAGIWIVEDIELLANGVRHGSWIDGVILSPDAQTFLVEGRRWDPPDEKVKEWHYIRTDKLPDPDIPPEWVGPPHD